MSANGVPVENIAQLVGHDRTATTESVYRHEIRPALTQGAEVMDKILASGHLADRDLIAAAANPAGSSACPCTAASGQRGLALLPAWGGAAPRRRRTCHCATCT